jgi:O-methyltransferase
VDEATELYLDLLKRCLLNYIYREAERDEVRNAWVRSWGGLRDLATQAVSRLLRRRSVTLRACSSSFDQKQREAGRVWPKYAHTMIGEKRLDNIRLCMERVLDDDVPGDFIETGVWRGGATIFMRAVLRAYGITERKVYVADSFEGLPPPDPDRPSDRGDRHHTFEQLRVSLDEVKRNFDRYGLLDDQVEFLKGWFSETLPRAPIDRLALMRLDGDMYQSTMDALVNLYPRLSVGGFVIVDDYGAIPACRRAVNDYREKLGIVDSLTNIDWTGVYWRRCS